MKFRQGLFAWVREFAPSGRHQAFDLAWNLRMADKEVVVTGSAEQYTIWIELRVVQSTSAVAQFDRTGSVQPTELLLDKVCLEQSVLSAQP